MQLLPQGLRGLSKLLSRSTAHALQLLGMPLLRSSECCV